MLPVTFKTPWVLLLIPVAVLGIIWLRRGAKQISFTFSSTQLFDTVPSTLKVRLSWVPFVLRLLALSVLLVALAGPRTILDETPILTEGIDIVLALDCSGSMAAEDFTINGRRQNRLDIVKNVVADFIDTRKGDRLGLVAFGARAYTVCPLTSDHDWLKQNLARVGLGIIEDGTAIGSGISSSILRLKNSKAKLRIIILLTDGVNNAGNIDPLTAAKSAQALGVKIYTIGAGTKGLAPFPVRDFFGNTFYQNVRIDLDEDSLRRIAEASGGQFFRATDTESLRHIYTEIDHLEKSDIKQVGYKDYRELFGTFVILALCIILLEIILANTFFLKVP